MKINRLVVYVNMDHDVYIIFGDSARSDGSNIFGVFNNLDFALEEKELLEQARPFEDFHIEEFYLHECLERR